MLKQVALVALMGLSASAMAGEWQVKVGASVLAPTQDNNVLAGGVFTNVDTSNEYGFTPSVEYFFNDNFSAELLLATPFSHEVKSNGQKIASFKHLPPTITAKYNFKNSSSFTPYIGVGATVAVPWHESVEIDGAKLDADVSYGVAGQIGLNFKPADAKNWGVFLDVRYADVKTDLTLKAGGVKLDIGELEIDPLVYTIGYSYKF